MFVYNWGVREEQICCALLHLGIMPTQPKVELLFHIYVYSYRCVVKIVWRLRKHSRLMCTLHSFTYMLCAPQFCGGSNYSATIITIACGSRLYVYYRNFSVYMLLNGVRRVIIAGADTHLCVRVVCCKQCHEVCKKITYVHKRLLLL